ncbi:MAG: hypothetical protein WC564_02820 [Patescibacteria group bacterium]|jgi:glutaredoxin
MTKKFLLLFLLLPLLLAGCTAVSNSEEKKSALDGQTILFYGETCAHCKVLEQYLEDNKINDKMSIEKLEVSKNKTNATLMMEAVNNCAISKNAVGVPFLWVDNKCYMGDVETTNFFKTKFKL